MGNKIQMIKAIITLIKAFLFKIQLHLIKRLLINRTNIQINNQCIFLIISIVKF